MRTSSSPTRAARRGSSSPASVRWARWRPIACHSSPTPSPVVGASWPAPAAASPTVRGQVEHALEVAAGVVGARAVGLVDDEHVGDLEQSGLVGLHRVAPAGVHHHDRGVGGARHLDLDLAHADRLDQHPRPPGGVEGADRLQGRERQPAEVAARGHRADEHRRRRWRGRPSGRGRRGSRRPRTATTGRWRARRPRRRRLPGLAGGARW